jgi:hypothetical protein
VTTPLFMRDVSLTFALVSAGVRVEYNCDAHLAAIESAPGDDVSYATLCPEGSFSEIGRTTYALHVVAVQDWSDTGLARFLWDNEGAAADFQYQAHGATVDPSAAAPGMAGTVTLVAPNYGGEAETYAELDVTMPCKSKPTIAVAAFPAAAAADSEALVAAEAIEAATAAA